MDRPADWAVEKAKTSEVSGDRKDPAPPRVAPRLRRHILLTGYIGNRHSRDGNSGFRTKAGVGSGLRQISLQRASAYFHALKGTP